LKSVVEKPKNQSKQRESYKGYLAFKFVSKLRDTVSSKGSGVVY